MEKVQPTFVLVSPYAFQNNKKIEFAAKNGPLLFATLSIICMIIFGLYAKDNLWLLFLPHFAIYSLVYILGHKCNKKTFQLTQIIITYLMAFFNEYLFLFANLYFAFNYYAAFIKLIIGIAVLSYPFVLHIVYRKHYVKDLSTPQSISTLNTVDFGLFLLFVGCFGIFGSITKQLMIMFPFYIDQAAKQKLLASSFSKAEIFTLASVCISSFLLTVLYRLLTNWNHSKSLMSVSDVEFDNNGRAWYSVSHLLTTDFCAFKRWCQMLTDKCRCCASNKPIGRTVQPHESQKPHLKPLTEMTV